MSTNITELLYNFAMNFFIKAPTLFSSAYIFIKTTNIKCSKSKLALLLTAFFVVNIISSVVLLFDNSLGFLASCILFIVTITLFTKNNIKIPFPSPLFQWDFPIAYDLSLPRFLQLHHTIYH